MANAKISVLPSAITPLIGTELIALAQSNITLSSLRVMVC